LKIPLRISKALFKPQKLINRPRFYYESGWMKYWAKAVPISLRRQMPIATRLLWCSRRSQYMLTWSRDCNKL